MLLSNGFDPDPRVHNEALALVEHGFDVEVICWNRDRGTNRPKAQIIDGIKIKRLGPRSKHNLGNVQTLFILLFWLNVGINLFHRNFDAIHCHDFDTLPIGFLLAKIKKCKLIYDAHEHYASMIGFQSGRFIAKMVFSAENQLIRYVDLVFTVGEILAKDFLRRGAKSVRIVGNWKNPDDFIFDDEKMESLRRRLGIKQDRVLVVCYITNLTAERFILPLMNAVAHQPNLFLIIGGNGPMEHIILNAAKNTDNVKYLGFVHPVDIPKYVALSDVIFYGFDTRNENSKYSAPNKLFEALAAGKIIVSGNFGEIGQIITRHDCGVLLENYESLTIRETLNLLFLKEDHLEEIKRKAVLLARSTYNWNNAKSILRQSYARLLDHSNLYPQKPTI
ncbi:MAG: glycosyltransferase [Candidatus Hodarchaeota archaeon]